MNFIRILITTFYILFVAPMGIIIMSSLVYGMAVETVKELKKPK